MCAWMRGGSEGGKEEGGVSGLAKPIAGMRGLWVGLQVSATHMRYMCICTYMEGLLLGLLCGPGGAWARSLCCKLNGTLGGIVLTCGYAGGFGNVWLGVGGSEEAARGEGKSKVLWGQ